jgi:hypothetical protein
MHACTRLCLRGTCAAPARSTLQESYTRSLFSDARHTDLTYHPGQPRRRPRLRVCSAPRTSGCGESVGSAPGRQAQPRRGAGEGAGAQQACVQRRMSLSVMTHDMRARQCTRVDDIASVRWPGPTAAHEHPQQRYRAARHHPHEALLSSTRFVTPPKCLL